MKLFYPNRPSADGGHEAHLNMKEQNEALTRLEESFPNGFHDAKLTALSLDLAGSRLRLGLLIEMSRAGESHVSSVYSKGELEITGLAAFCVGGIRFGRMEASASDEMVDVSHDSSECQRLAKALDDETCFVAEVYLLRSNASITFAGRGAQWSWTGKA